MAIKQDETRARKDTSQRYGSDRATGFAGGSIDPVTGNFVPPTYLQVSGINKAQAKPNPISDVVASNPDERETRRPPVMQEPNIPGVGANMAGDQGLAAAIGALPSGIVGDFLGALGAMVGPQAGGPVGMAAGAKGGHSLGVSAANALNANAIMANQEQDDRDMGLAGQQAQQSMPAAIVDTAAIAAMSPGGATSSPSSPSAPGAQEPGGAPSSQPSESGQVEGMGGTLSGSPNTEGGTSFSNSTPGDASSPGAVGAAPAGSTSTGTEPGGSTSTGTSQGTEAGGSTSSGGSEGGSDGGGCFITEAVMAAGGQGDNAMPLQVLRLFRDRVLTRTPQGQQLIAEYDALAPLVVTAVSQRPDALQIFGAIYHNYLGPAVEALLGGDLNKALGIYAEMLNFVSEFASEGAQIDYDYQADPMQGMERLGSDASMVAHNPLMQGEATGVTGGELLRNVTAMPPGVQLGAPTAGVQQPGIADGSGDMTAGGATQEDDYPTPLRYGGAQRRM